MAERYGSMGNVVREVREMGTKVVATIVLEDLWATEEELREMSDQDIIDLIHEDTLEFLQRATWTVERGEDKA